METSSVKPVLGVGVLACWGVGCWAAGMLGCSSAEEGGCAFALDYFWIRHLSFYKVEDVLSPLLWLAAAGRGVVQKVGLAGKESDPCQVGPGPASVTNVQGSELLTLSHIWDHEAGSRGHLENALYVQEKWNKNHRSFLQTGLSVRKRVQGSPTYARGRLAASPNEIFSPLRLKVLTEAAVNLQIKFCGWRESVYGGSVWEFWERHQLELTFSAMNLSCSSVLIMENSVWLGVNWRTVCRTILSVSICGTSTLSKATYTRSSLFLTYTCSSGDEENGCRATWGISNNEPHVPGGQDVSLTAQWPPSIVLVEGKIVKTSW